MTVGPVPVAKIVSPVALSTFRAGDRIQLIGMGLTEQGTQLARGYGKFTWAVSLKHDEHLHPYRDNLVGETISFEIPKDGHEFTGDVTLYIELTVTTGESLRSNTHIVMIPQELDLRIMSSHPDVPVSISGIPYPSPHIHESVVSFELPLSVSQETCVNGTKMVFLHWDLGWQTEPVLQASFTLTVPGLERGYSSLEQNNSTTARAVFEPSGDPCVAERTNLLTSPCMEDYQLKAVPTGTTTITCVPCFAVFDVAKHCVADDCSSVRNVDDYCKKLCPATNSFYATFCSDIDKTCTGSVKMGTTQTKKSKCTPPPTTSAAPTLPVSANHHPASTTTSPSLSRCEVLSHKYDWSFFEEQGLCAGSLVLDNCDNQGTVDFFFIFFFTHNISTFLPTFFLLMR